tara:strand:+ start:674 stop:889 length:216 start_codon:yes stop_codon:yes gene_type:complete
MNAAAPLASSLIRGGNGLVWQYKFYNDRGPTCESASRVVDEFFDQEYDEVRERFLDLLAEFRKIEGEDFGS